MQDTPNITILIATGLYPPDIGGPATYSRMLEEKLHDHGIATVIVPFGTVRHLPKLIRHIVYAWKLWKQSVHSDIIYALDPVSVGVPALLISRLRRKPFLVRLGGDYAWEQGQQRFGLTQTLDEYTQHRAGAPVMVRVLAQVQRFVVCRAKIVIAPSEYLKSIIVSWNVDASKVKVIYSALFPLEVQEDRQQLREQLAYEGTVITTVGRLVPWKGFSELIDVVKQLQSEIPDISLIIIGDGPDYETLQKKIVQLDMQHSVRLLGKLGKDALGAAIKGSDLFVLNTSYEGLSHQLLEVMELGVPIVTTNIGGNPELITDGVSGRLVPYNDANALKVAMLEILTQNDRRDCFIQNAHMRTIAFTHTKVIAELVTVLRSML